MKKIIILSLALFSTLTISAREITKNPDTKMTLTENLGVYSITGSNGAIVLGDEDSAREFFNKAVKSFTINAVNNLLDIKGTKYELKQDKDGYYLIKVGFGAVKIRYSDALWFAGSLDGKAAYDTGKELIKGGKEKVKELWMTVTEQ